MRFLSLLFIISSLFIQRAQAQPVSNVYLFDMEQLNDQEFRFSNPKYLTDFNSNGYNNQPAFFSDNELYLSVQTKGMAQPDLYLLNLQNRTRALVTQTPEGEYSPALSPDPYFFTAVRVENNRTQRLWQFPTDRLSNGKPVFKYIENVGYYHWLSGSRVALFIVDNPNYLALADVRTDRTQKLTSNVGRSFQTLPNGNLAYVHKVTDRTWYIKELEVFSPQLESEIVVTTLPESEDFIILKNGTYIMGNGSKLFKYNPFIDKDQGWQEIGDFRYYGIRNITRLALSPSGKIAIVSEGRSNARAN